MTLKQDLILRAICSFSYNGIADFIYENLNGVGKNESVKPVLKQLEDMGYIKDITKNGYAKRFEIYQYLPCPEFVFYDIHPIYKYYLLSLWNEMRELGVLTTRDKEKDTKLSLMGYDVESLFKQDEIHNKISSNGYLIKDDFGYKIANRKAMTYKCKYCGDTNEANFNKSNKSVCKSCQKKILESSNDIASNLLRRSKNNSKTLKIDYELDLEFIQDMLEKQNYKCCYSGVKFKSSFNDKYYYPTIDRIDSRKGYTKDNVCICTFVVNRMKNDLDLYDFKDLISKINSVIN